MPRGKASLFDVMHLTPEDFRRLDTEYQPTEVLAKHLGVTDRTVYRWRKLYGEPKPRVRPPRDSNDLTLAHESSRIAKWLRENPGKKLPRNSTEAEALTGIGAGVIRHWRQRHKERMLKYCQSLGDLRMQMNSSLFTTKNRKVPCRLITSYDLRIDVYEATVTIRATLRGPYFVEAKYSIRGYYDLFEHHY